jgi:hypothetical protein
MTANTPSAVRPSGRITRLISLVVLIGVVALAVYFLIRGAWWVSALLILLEIFFEAGLRARKRKRASSRKNGAAI